MDDDFFPMTYDEERIIDMTVDEAYNTGDLVYGLFRWFEKPPDRP